jgi:hypothetical protein
VISVIISIKKFHALFSTEANYITFLSEDNKTKYYNRGNISPSMAGTPNYFITVHRPQKHYKEEVRIALLFVLRTEI